MDKTHVQICVRNPAVSIRAYFRLREFPKRSAIFASESDILALNS